MKNMMAASSYHTHSCHTHSSHLLIHDQGSCREPASDPSDYSRAVFGLHVHEDALREHIGGEVISQASPFNSCLKR